MKHKNTVKEILDNFLINKEGRSILKNIEKKKLVDEGLLDSLDILTIASEIEKKTKKKIDISKPKNFNKFNKYKDLIKI
jgi:acyl carrier protein|tara:strand:- start:830 stop:1066 length:237 start_codon:yes stop_codon:yes gene_type:complete